MKTYEKLTIDDIHEIRRNNDIRFAGRTWEERVAATNEAADRVQAEIDVLRARRLFQEVTAQRTTNL
ncbi:MAG: hypothetical protein LBN97_09685 [Oscillospiraceae bacterium]|jgi:hypothetical protein|nr:hypothetical protein [Oscillospiraceae bacterium]